MLGVAGVSLMVTEDDNGSDEVLGAACVLLKTEEDETDGEVVLGAASVVLVVTGSVNKAVELEVVIDSMAVRGMVEEEVEVLEATSVALVSTE